MSLFTNKVTNSQHTLRYVPTYGRIIVCLLVTHMLVHDWGTSGTALRASVREFDVVVDDAD